MQPAARTQAGNEDASLTAAVRLAALGRGLGDPVRARILLLLAEGRTCCIGLPTTAPAGPDDVGVCVCELEGVLGLRQSLVSYHLRLLKEAGLVQEERRGRWSFYSLNRAVLHELVDWLGALARREPPQPPPGARTPAGRQAEADAAGKEGSGMGCCECCGGGCCGGGGGCC